MTAMGWYDREGNPMPDSTSEEMAAIEAKLSDHDYKVVKRETIKVLDEDWGDVSTVWLGLDHSFTTEGRPMIFETMVFGGPLDGETHRYATEQEAIEGHKRMAEAVAKSPCIRVTLAGIDEDGKTGDVEEFVGHAKEASDRAFQRLAERLDDSDDVTDFNVTVEVVR